MGRRSCELEPGLSTTLQPLLSQCKLEGTSLFGGQCKSCDIVITQFGLYVTLASRPGARPGGFGAALTARPFPTSSTVDGNNSFGLMLISASVFVIVQRQLHRCDTVQMGTWSASLPLNVSSIVAANQDLLGNARRLPYISGLQFRRQMVWFLRAGYVIYTNYRTLTAKTHSY